MLLFLHWYLYKLTNKSGTAEIRLLVLLLRGFFYDKFGQLSYEIIIEIGEKVWKYQKIGRAHV